MLECIGNYKFNNLEHLQNALRHPSAGHGAFQRLEFMGDSVLNLVITDALMEQFPFESEGALSKRRAALVSRETCQAVGDTLSIRSLLTLGSNVDLVNSSIVADAVEAVIGAIYFDSNKDISVCRSWIMSLWGRFIATNTNHKKPPIDPKTALQEWTQAQRHPAPVYREIARYGPDHDLTLHVCVSIPGLEARSFVAEGQGRTKKAAEKMAAAKLLEIIEK